MSLLDPHAFTLATARTLGRTVVRVTGELDAATAPVLRKAFVDLVEEQGSLDVVVDVSELSFIDSAGLGVLVAASRKLTNLGGELTLSAPTRAVAKVLQTTGVDSFFTITRT